MEAANVVLHRELLEALNSWDEGQLRTLRGIGPQRAKKILGIRQGDGHKEGRRIANLWELKEVGMNPKQIEELFLVSSGQPSPHHSLKLTRIAPTCRWHP